jgi:hypothetical protein
MKFAIDRPCLVGFAEDLMLVRRQVRMLDALSGGWLPALAAKINGH